MVNWKSKLQKICAKLNFPYPSYIHKYDDNLWISTALSNRYVAISKPFKKKSQSDIDAAEALFNKLSTLFQNVDNLLNNEIEEKNDNLIFPFLNSDESKMANAYSSDNFTETKLEFNNNCFDKKLLKHLKLIVNRKAVEITNDVEYPLGTSPIVFYLIKSTRNKVISTLSRSGVKIFVPCINNVSYQSIMISSMCMELGADSVAILNNINERVPLHITLS